MMGREDSGGDRTMPEAALRAREDVVAAVLLSSIPIDSVEIARGTGIATPRLGPILASAFQRGEVVRFKGPGTRFLWGHPEIAQDERWAGKLAPMECDGPPRRKGRPPREDVDALGAGNFAGLGIPGLMMAILDHARYCLLSPRKPQRRRWALNWFLSQEEEVFSLQNVCECLGMDRRKILAQVIQEAREKGIDVSCASGAVSRVEDRD